MARATLLIGGPWGRYAAASRSRWSAMRVVLGLTCFTLVLAYTEKSPCANGD